MSFLFLFFNWWLLDVIYHRTLASAKSSVGSSVRYTVIPASDVMPEC